MLTVREIRKKYHVLAPLDLELILSFVTKRPREFVISHPEYNLTSRQIKKINFLMKRRKKGEPLAYLTGTKEFYGLDFKVSKNTLIPRPETELLVEKGLAETSKQQKNIFIIDVGTGSGNIIISIAHNLGQKIIKGKLPDFWGIDLSRPALTIARKNARRYQLEKLVNFRCGNLLGPVLRKINPSYSVIILANLPYLPQSWKKSTPTDATQGLKFEPARALYGGKDGLFFYRQLADQIKQLNNTNVVCFCEIDPSQKKELAEIFFFAAKITFHQDLAKRLRVAEIRF